MLSDVEDVCWGSVRETEEASIEEEKEGGGGMRSLRSLNSVMFMGGSSTMILCKVIRTGRTTEEGEEECFSEEEGEEGEEKECSDEEDEAASPVSPDKQHVHNNKNTKQTTTTSLPGLQNKNALFRIILIIERSNRTIVARNLSVFVFVSE